MGKSLNRRKFLNRMVIPAAFGSGAFQLKMSAQSKTVIAPPEVTRPEPKRPAPLNGDQVFEFVRVCHGNIDRTSELLDEEPKLIYASWDWGGGDWETGLRGASHIGRRDIAGMLLSHGARKDIFAAAMLGEREVVEAMVNVDPKMAEQIGPHGYRVLYNVAISGDISMAASVMSKVKIRKPYLNQALPAALRDGHYEMTSWLLEQGATSVNKPNAIGEKPLQTAIRRGDTEIAELLREYGAKELD